jgi:uncharacterized protein
MTRSCCYLTLLLCLVTAPLACQLSATGTPAQLLKTAETGDAQAQFELGRAYEDGKGVAQDDAHAVQWFRKSAEQGNAQAQNSLGVMFALGRGVPRDREEAVRWYKKAAKQGLTEAIYNVATSYYNGEGIGEDMSLAYAWMMAAQKRGDAQAADALQRMRDGLSNQVDAGTFELAQLYRKGNEIPQDLPAAVSFYLEDADHKPPLWFTDKARYELCLLYVGGAGVQDYGQAKSWCKKSGSPFADMVLGRMAEKGLGGDKNPQEALDYYRKAAASNIAEGYMEAGRLRMESGSHDGEKKAYFWYAIAAKAKFLGAAEKLQEAAIHLSEKEIAEQQKQLGEWLKMPAMKRASEYEEALRRPARTPSSSTCHHNSARRRLLAVPR